MADSRNFQDFRRSNPNGTSVFSGRGRAHAEERERNDRMSSRSSENQVECRKSMASTSELMPWDVLKAIPGSIGGAGEVAEKLGVSYTVLKKFLSQHPEIQEELDNEREKSVEKIMREQYNDAIDGNMQARESYIKMVSGYFSRKDAAKENMDDRVQVNIVMPDAPSEKHVAIDSDSGELVELDDDFRKIGKLENKVE